MIVRMYGLNRDDVFHLVEVFRDIMKHRLPNPLEDDIGFELGEE